MLNERGAAFEYREYTKAPLNADEIRAVLGKLGVSPAQVLRRRDKAFAANALSGDEPDDVLIELMAQNPGLLQRPIAVVGDRAVIGRPVENLLALL